MNSPLPRPPASSATKLHLLRVLGALACLSGMLLPSAGWLSSQDGGERTVLIALALGTLLLLLPRQHAAVRSSSPNAAPQKLRWAISALFGVTLTLAVPLVPWVLRSPDELHPWSFTAAWVVIWSVGISCTIEWLLRTPWWRLEGDRSRPGLWGLGAAVVLLPAWGLWLWAFWPGILTPDSIAAWEQSITWQMTDWHPFLYPLLLSALRKIADTPASVGAFQILFTLTTVGWVIAKLRGAGAPAWSLVASICLLLVLPVHGLMAITLWRDSIYSTFVLLLVAFAFSVVVQRPDRPWINSWVNLIALSVVCLGAALFRHNGPAPAAATLLALLLLDRANWRRYTLATLVVGASFMFVKGPVQRMLGITPSNIAAGPVLHHFAAHVTAGTPLEPAERAFLSRIRTLETPWPYSCFVSDLTAYDSSVSRSVITDDLSQSRAIFWALLERAPFVNLRHSLCVSSLSWRVYQAHGGYTFPVWIEQGDRQLRYVVSNSYGISEQSQAPAVQSDLFPLFSTTFGNRHLQAIVWRPAFWMYALLFAILALWVAGWRYDWKVVLLAAPILGQALPVMALAGTQDMRYQYPIMLTGALFLMPLLALRPYPRSPRAASPEPS